MVSEWAIHIFGHSWRTKRFKRREKVWLDISSQFEFLLILVRVRNLVCIFEVINREEFAIPYQHQSSEFFGKVLYRLILPRNVPLCTFRYFATVHMNADRMAIILHFASRSAEEVELMMPSSLPLTTHLSLFLTIV